MPLVFFSTYLTNRANRINTYKNMIRKKSKKIFTQYSVRANSEPVVYFKGIFF